jgi:magnesium transporter
MQIFVHRKDADKVEEGFTREQLPDLLADDNNCIWVDLRGETDEQVEEAREVLMNVFKFHYLTIEDCIETRNQPKVEGFPDYLFFIVHGVKPEETTSTNFVTKELDGFLGKNYVVTFHRERFRSIKAVKQHIRSSTYTTGRGPAYLLHEILDRLIDLYMPLVDDFDESITSLESRVFQMKKTNNSILTEIMNLRRAVARLKRISSRQLEVLYRMSHGEFVQIPEKITPFFRDVHDHLLRISDLAESYRDLIGGLFEIHLAVVGNKTNEVMKILAVISVIILPLSLIAGVYGMNFDNMPELHSQYGYWATMGAMVLITIVLLTYFWRIGWIFQKDDADIAVDDTIEG